MHQYAAGRRIGERTYGRGDAIREAVEKRRIVEHGAPVPVGPQRCPEVLVVRTIDRDVDLGQAGRSSCRVRPALMGLHQVDDGGHAVVTNRAPAGLGQTRRRVGADKGTWPGLSGHPRSTGRRGRGRCSSRPSRVRAGLARVDSSCGAVADLGANGGSERLCQSAGFAPRSGRAAPPAPRIRTTMREDGMSRTVTTCRTVTQGSVSSASAISRRAGRRRSCSGYGSATRSAGRCDSRHTVTSRARSSGRSAGPACRSRTPRGSRPTPRSRTPARHRPAWRARPNTSRSACRRRSTRTSCAALSMPRFHRGWTFSTPWRPTAATWPSGSTPPSGWSSCPAWTRARSATPCGGSWMPQKCRSSG